jgi:hypothetical protein
MPRTYLQKDRCKFSIGVPLLKESFLLCQNLDSQGIYTWFSYAKSIIDETGLDIL